MFRRHLGLGSVSAIVVWTAVVGVCGFAAESPSATALGPGQAVVSITLGGIEAELQGTLSFDFWGRALEGCGHGTGELDILALAGWAWGVVWASSSEPSREPVTLVGGLAVEGSPALGSGSVEGACYFVLRQAGTRADYRGTFVTQASSRLVPSPRPGTLALEGDIRLAFTLTPCPSGEKLPWDSSRWPRELLAEFVARAGL